MGRCPASRPARQSSPSALISPAGQGCPGGQKGKPRAGKVPLLGFFLAWFCKYNEMGLLVHAVNGLTKAALEAIRVSQELEEVLRVEMTGDEFTPWGTMERLQPLLYTWTQVGGWVGGGGGLGCVCVGGGSDGAVSPCGHHRKTSNAEQHAAVCGRHCACAPAHAVPRCACCRARSACSRAG